MIKQNSGKENELIGIRLNQYHLEALIKQTSKSLVFRAKDLVLEREVALKILKQDQDDKRKEQFLEEGKKLANLEEHDNITTVYSAGEDRNLHYIAMKLVEGPDLEDFIHRKFGIYFCHCYNGCWFNNFY